jgi:DNA invertase Pin-like site-specific DNA recombinase
MLTALRLEPSIEIDAVREMNDEGKGATEIAMGSAIARTSVYWVLQGW